MKNEDYIEEFNKCTLALKYEESFSSEFSQTFTKLSFNFLKHKEDIEKIKHG